LAWTLLKTTSNRRSRDGSSWIRSKLKDKSKANKREAYTYFDLYCG